MKKSPLKAYFFSCLLSASGFFWALPLHALEVESFADGLCWISDEGISTKLVSFNDNVAVSFSKDELFYLALESDEAKRIHKNSSAPELNYHCGSYGHSAIVIDRASDQCVWMYFKEGNWQIRSRGIIAPHESSSKSCHGLKPGSLVLNVTSAADKEAVKLELLKNYGDEIDSLTDLSSKVVKVSLKEKYVGSEKAVREKLMKNHFVGPRVNVEFNWLTHPVGEFKE